MMKKFVVLLACLGLAFQITGCTSKNNSADTELAADFDSADLEKIDGEEAMEVSGDNTLQSDQLPEDALGETPSTTVADSSADAPLDLPADTPAEPQADVAATDSLPADPFADSASVESVPPPAQDTWSSSSTSTTTTVDPATDSTTMVESKTTTEHSTTVVDSEPTPKVSAPLQKVSATPWKANGVWFNTVYFARPGDTLSSISKAIYGSNKTAQLKAGNPTFKSRGVKPGDKVYYNSPNRPEDSSRVMTYQEDNGIQPETYVAKAGDNIRKVSKSLLGYDGAWKEVWSSNSVDSKGDIAEGTELRYWRDGLVASAPKAPAAAPAQPEMAASQPPAGFPEPPPMEQPAPQAPDQFAQNDIPPPPMPDQMHDQGAPPPPADMAQNEMAPPPPPVEAVNPPTPPPQPHHAAIEEEAPQGMDDTTTALAVVGLAAAGLAILVVVRKKRKQRELEQQAMDNTHVGT